MEISPTLKKRTTPLSSSLPHIRRGVNPKKDPRLLKIKPELIPSISRDRIASKYLRPFVNKTNVFTDQEITCLWIEDLCEDLLGSSEVLEAVWKEDFRHENADQGDTFQLVAIPPQCEYLAIPFGLDDKYEYLPVAKFQPEIIAHYDLGIIDNDYTLALGVVSCRLFRVWKKRAPEYLGTTNRPGFGTIYNSFPMPDLSITERRSIEAGARHVEDTRLYFTGRSLRELYEETMKPIQLRNAHQELNEVVFPCFGLPIDAEENVIMERLVSYYSMMTNS